MFDIPYNVRPQDILDILIVTYIIYRIMILIQGTRAVQMLFGLALIFILFFVSQRWELYTLNWILGNFLASIIIITVILFQNDIKRALAALRKDPLFRRLDEKQGEEFVVDEVVKAASFLANRSIGALIAIERKNSLVELVELGMKIDALVSREFIISIFNPESPLHDGGMIIRENRVLSVGSFFPLATDPDLERELGTRHRAAVGLSRDTDAVVIVVSEESGTISLAVEGNLTRSLDATSLNNLLLELLGVKKEPTTQRKILNRILGKREVEKPTL